MARIFRLSIDEETLTDELFAFVVDPRSTRYQRRVVTELKVIAPRDDPGDGDDDPRRRGGAALRARVRERRVLGDGADQDVYYAT